MSLNRNQARRNWIGREGRSIWHSRPLPLALDEAALAAGSRQLQSEPGRRTLCHLIRMRLPSTARRLRSRPAWAVLAVLVRVLTVLISLQFCGVIHDFSDAVRSIVAAEELQHEKCPPDGPCEDCPPGCPNCHCAAVRSIVPNIRLDVTPDLLEASLPTCLYATQAVAGPDRPCLFRPPRG
jgi:hypothetical protein